MSLFLVPRQRWRLSSWFVLSIGWFDIQLEEGTDWALCATAGAGDDNVPMRSI